MFFHQYCEGTWVRPISVKARVTDANSTDEAEGLKRVILKTVLPPYNMTTNLEKYLGKWVTTDVGSLYYFKQPDPSVRGLTPGVILTVNQMSYGAITLLFDEAEKLQVKIEEMLLLLQKVIYATNESSIETQTKRFKYLEGVDLNQIEFEESFLNFHDEKWIFDFSLGALRVETVMRGYRHLLRRLNYILKKLVCMREGLRHREAGHTSFLMMAMETALYDRSAKEMIEVAKNESYDACQFVEAKNDNNIKFNFIDVVTETQDEVDLIMKDVN